MHHIERLTKIIDPDALEAYLVRLVGGDLPPVGRVDDAWHITDRLQRPALLLFRHAVIRFPTDIDTLHALMEKTRIPIGYLITPGKFTARIYAYSRAVDTRIILLDGYDLFVMDFPPLWEQVKIQWRYLWRRHALE